MHFSLRSVPVPLSFRIYVYLDSFVNSKPLFLQLALSSCFSLYMLQLLFLFQILTSSIPLCQAVGYSYTRFVGPVSGPEHKVFIQDALNGNEPYTDFIAQPRYEFAYGVEDRKTRVLQSRKESRDGDAVKGVYSVVDPDGNLRTVKYTADNMNGFQAEVITNGARTYHGHNRDNNDHSYKQANDVNDIVHPDVNVPTYIDDYNDVKSRVPIIQKYIDTDGQYEVHEDNTDYDYDDEYGESESNEDDEIEEYDEKAEKEDYSSAESSSSEADSYEED